jgi:hypothetical protein
LPLIQWTTVRLVVSENDWRRHDSAMEPQGGGNISPLPARRRNRTRSLSNTTLEARVHVQTVGLNAETKKCRHRADGEECLLTFPFYRTCPISALSLTTPTVSRDFILIFFCARTHLSQGTRFASPWLPCFTCITPNSSGRFCFIDSVLPTKHLFGHDRP